tara:strand:+ start:8170 stop:8706 length:537 start_codon:yes stop_codon:yes gene_type:complete
VNKVKEIKKLVSYGLITLIGFSLFVGCEDEIIIASEEENVSFNIRLPIDGNGYYHLTMERGTWQTLHRVEGSAYTNDGNPIEFFWVEWESDLYWYLGDTLGYIVNEHLNDNGVYVSVDTSYMIGFNGMEVPTSNSISYSNSGGEINNMIAPVRSMIGDTLTLTAIWYNSEKDFKIVLD